MKLKRILLGLEIMEQLNEVSGRILKKYLFATNACDNLIAEPATRFLELVNCGCEIFDLDRDY